jgi:ferric-dicitrate binding protein FerR (iron transport regulator)
LNAASSLRYPTAFTGAERKVTVTGEAYFEVAHNARMPFVVNVNDKEEVTVLGTHFNINAYDNENAIHTTLLQGSVKVGSRQWAIGSGEKAKGSRQRAETKEQSVMLKPGQQAILSQSSQQSQTIPVQTVDVDKVIAWKNGVFNFDGATLQEVMHQLERWYDIEVQYEPGVPNLEFVGKMGRDLSLNNVLRGLELSKVHFRLEGRKLTVMP